jgi:xylulokinase
MDPLYANARGAAWIGAVGLNEIYYSDIPQLVNFNHIYVPNNNNRVVYDDHFALFINIYKQMKVIYHKMNG